MIVKKVILKTNTMTKKAVRKISQRNELTRASYSLSLNGKRMLSILIMLFNKSKNTKRIVCIRAKDFAKISNLGIDGVYSVMEKTANELLDLKIKIVLNNQLYSIERLFSKCWFFKGSGKVEFRLAEDVIPLVSNLTERFTQYNLDYALSLNNVYSMRLFELISQFKSVGQIVILVSDFKFILGIETKKTYSRFKYLNEQIIRKSVIEINKKIPELKLKTSFIREGRRVNSIRFDFVCFNMDDFFGKSKTANQKNQKRLTTKSIRSVAKSKLIKSQLGSSEPNPH